LSSAVDKVRAAHRSARTHRSPPERIHVTTLPPDDRPSVPPPGMPAFAPPVPEWRQGSVAQAALGSRAARFGGSLVDSAVTVGPTVAVTAAIGDTDAGAALVVLLYFVSYVLYAPLLMMRRGANNGQTLGKQVAGLRVVHESGEPMTLGRGLLRETVGKSLLTAVTCGIYALPDSLWCLWDPKKQCLHDKVGSTFVLDAAADPRVAATLRA
jgi:uncharacterized RDD family membrane protein YckC